VVAGDDPGCHTPLDVAEVVVRQQMSVPMLGFSSCRKSAHGRAWRLCRADRRPRRVTTPDRACAAAVMGAAHALAHAELLTGWSMNGPRFSGRGVAVRSHGSGRSGMRYMRRIMVNESP